MAKVVVMPKLGLTMTEGKIGKWMKSEGDYINKGEVLLEVSTDKLTNDVEALESGYVRTLIGQEGDVIACLQAIAIIAEKDEDISDLLIKSSSKVQEPSSESPKNELKEVEKASKAGGRVKASPKAKKKAKELSVDLSEVVGTGPKGRITVEDVEGHHAVKDKVKSSPTAKKIADNLDIDLKNIAKEGRIMKQDVLDFDTSQKILQRANPQEERLAMSQMRQVIASRMLNNWTTIPAVSFDIKVDMTECLKMKNRLKAVHKVTITDLLVKVSAEVLLKHPMVNAMLDRDEIILRNYTNIGVAVAIEDGLMVPVVKYANVKGLKEISTEIKSLAKKAQSNSIDLGDLQGGTFTITNLGMFGINSFSPIINAPEVAILGVNTIEEVLSFVDGQVVSKPMMTLSLTADHRVVDGAVAANFLKDLKLYIENPEMLLL